MLIAIKVIASMQIMKILIPPPSPPPANAIQDDTIGNFVSFRNCIFERNAALEYGGAVGFILPSFNIIFHNRDSIIPMEFNNW